MLRLSKHIVYTPGSLVEIINLSSMPSGQVFVPFDFEGSNKCYGENGEKLNEMISSITKNEPFSALVIRKMTKKKVFYPFGINLVAKIRIRILQRQAYTIKTKKFSKSSDLNLIIKAKKIS